MSRELNNFINGKPGSWVDDGKRFRDGRWPQAAPEVFK